MPHNFLIKIKKSLFCLVFKFLTCLYWKHKRLLSNLKWKNLLNYFLSCLLQWVVFRYKKKVLFSSESSRINRYPCFCTLICMFPFSKVETHKTPYLFLVGTKVQSSVFKTRLYNPDLDVYMLWVKIWVGFTIYINFIIIISPSFFRKLNQILWYYHKNSKPLKKRGNIHSIEFQQFPRNNFYAL